MLEPSLYRRRHTVLKIACRVDFLVYFPVTITMTVNLSNAAGQCEWTVESNELLYLMYTVIVCLQMYS